jgi:MFS family permease
MEALKLVTGRTLPNRVAYVLAASVIGLGLFASLTPSPLYRSYSVLWHFSPLTLTLIYATYAFGVLATLLLAGSVSDVVGRRPVLLAALAGLMGSTVLFLLADSVAWLFVARGLQGLATGGLSAASAALLDLHPRRDPPASGSLTSRGSGGIGLGARRRHSSARLGRLLPLSLLVLGVAFVDAYFTRSPCSSVHAGSRSRLSVGRRSRPCLLLCVSPLVDRALFFSSARSWRLLTRPT